MKFIISGDWHLTDDPLDEYRWNLFPFLEEKIQAMSGSKHAGWVRDMTVYSGAWLVILGDLSQRKDYHSGYFVNRVVSGMVRLYRAGLHGIIILGGNHDGLGGAAFFEFLRHFPYIKYITQPTVESIGFTKLALLPHTKHPKEDWKHLDLTKMAYIFTHITVSGAKAETGYELDGNKEADFLKDLRLGLVTGTSRIYSGDVHVPQKLGAFEYVGAPYPIRFGDRYKGRVLVVDTRTGYGKYREEWHPPAIKKAKLQISDVAELGKAWLRKGDQLKVELVLPREDRHRWHHHREAVQAWCDNKGVVLCGVELAATGGVRRLRLKDKPRIAPAEVEGAMDSYLRKTQAPPEAREVGRRLLRKAQGTT